MNDIASVYWIKHKDHTDIFSEGYVGVSKNAKRRWYQHKSNVKNNKHENNHLYYAILKHGMDSIVLETILTASEQYCYEIENKLRNKENIGWNLAKGGSKPPVSKPRGENYKSPLKGKKRPTPWMIGRKLSEKQKEVLSKIKMKKIEYQNVIFNSFDDLAKHLNIKYSTLTNRIYRNPDKWGYKVIA